MSNSVRPHRWQPTRLPRPWDSPGKNTGVGCHFLLQCMKVKSESEVAQSCLTFHNPMDCSLPGSSIHGIFQARVLESGAVAFSLKTAEGTKHAWSELNMVHPNLFTVKEWSTDLWTQWGKERVGRIEKVALTYIYYCVYNRQLVRNCCTEQCSVMM